MAAVGSIVVGAAAARSPYVPQHGTETRHTEQVRSKGPAYEMRLERAERAGAELRFRDLAGPMVEIPGGEFLMGDLASLGEADERPVHLVRVGPFLLGKHEVTVGDFRRFVDATKYQARGCWGLNLESGRWAERPDLDWDAPGFAQSDAHPVSCVSWRDAQAYVSWLRAETGLPLRLPTEAEWEFAARAGATTRFPWGDGVDAGCEYANGADRTPFPGSTRLRTARFDCDDGHFFTAPVGSYRGNAFGLHDMIGNVWEWTEDCWNDTYQDAPSDGTAWTAGNCARRVVRGGSWDGKPEKLLVSGRGGDGVANRGSALGFRLAQDIFPRLQDD